MSKAKNPSIAVLKRSNGAERIGYGSETAKAALDRAGKSYLYGNLGETHSMIAAAVRRYSVDSPTWEIISDSAHVPVNFETVTDGVELAVTYKGEKINALTVVPDERFASCGAVAGASVGADSANIRMGVTCSFVVDLDAETIAIDDRFFGQGRFGVSIAASGLITLTHPQRQITQLPIIQHLTDSSTAEDLSPFDIRESGAGVTTLYLKARMAGRIEWTGAAWAASNAPFSSGDFTFSYDDATGVLTVTHPAIYGNVQPAVTPYGATSDDYSVHVFDATGTGFKVKFRNVADGSVPPSTPIPANLGFYFDRGKSAILTSPTGRLHVDLGTVQVDMRDVDFQFANLWIHGTMGRTPPVES